MTLRRKAVAIKAPLSAAVACVLLGGWSELPSEGGNDSSGLFDMAMERDEGLARRWREHEPYLRAEAKRRRIEPRFAVPGQPGATMFFAERVSKYSWLEISEADASWQEDDEPEGSDTWQ